MNQAVEPRKYFDLHLRGLGYLSRVRDVTAKGSGRSKAKPFLACAISAFHGDPNVENGIVYLPLDLIVSGEKAREAVRAVMGDANDPDAKVLVAFRSGDHYIRTFERTGNRAGETGAILKGRLLKLFWIKVDGEEVYRDEGEDTEAEANASGETVNGELATSEQPDEHGVSETEPPDNRRETVQSGEDVSETGRAAPRTNRYPPLHRNSSGTVRRSAASDR
ncbi:DUF3577 domain-containing protein [Burkholderia multivorans]|uniref:DUF3577 domain-containing protein n=1 Tax=Burkholderia multivorans TaxID=87883 RepID=UPI0021C226BF|nr:DUF3577 domain-containing protein [Burkholderia multivorans]MDR8763320.1 hypothetical protein [Burkholderia multivorans]MDR8768995.1 hypothetical protein [Burkholderia multivorans]MDR8774909.1 hypothetical protein [Burkholderia multivorans]MDR8792521.1 hypothetical protein [Burkholderia multivorans]MDR8798620.1 hypothetical protein [Burkholderia multivorans]